MSYTRIFCFSIPKLEGSPSYERVFSFRKYFLSVGLKEVEENIPKNISDFKGFLSRIKNYKNNYFFISMPPFRYFWLFLIPGLRVILDIRDGWSISQASGYGGKTKKKLFKAKLSRVIERFIIRRSYFSITCTPGLQKYLSKISGCNILLIPNGVSSDDLKLINGIKNESYSFLNKESLVFCCAGQFSEYGKEKVKLILYKISNRYKENSILIKLIGCDEVVNSWVSEYFNDLTLGRGTVEILPRMDKKELFNTLANADYGLTVLRDPSYELGTKIYDYIALDLPVVNYFDRPNNFTDYFDACLDVPFNSRAIKPEICRNILIEKELFPYFKESK